MRKLDICPICGKLGKKYIHWTVSNGKKYRYVVYQHDDHVTHRLNIEKATSIQSKSSLVREFLLLKLQKPMRFSDIVKLLKKETALTVDNRIVTRSINFLIKRNLIEKRYLNNVAYYAKKESNVNSGIKVEKIYLTFKGQSLHAVIELYNGGNSLIQDVMIYLPFEITNTENLTTFDTYGVVDKTSLTALYSLNDISLLLIKLNVELKPAETTILILNIPIVKNKEDFTIRIPYDTGEIDIIMMHPFLNMKASIMDIDLLTSKVPDIVKNITTLSGEKIQLIKFYKIKKDQVINLLPNKV